MREASRIGREPPVEASRTKSGNDMRYGQHVASPKTRRNRGQHRGGRHLRLLLAGVRADRWPGAS